MNKSVLSMLAVAALAGTAATTPAQAAGDGGGEASAAVFRADLDVSLLNKTVDVPLDTSLNAIRVTDGERTARQTALTARLAGVAKGEPFPVLRAETADAEAGKNDDGSWSRVTLAKARVQVPGLPRLSVVELEQVTAEAECAAGKQPAARSELPGSVKALGKRVTLSAGGPTVVEAPGVGSVRLELSREHTTSRTAAATALRLSVSVDPLDLGVAKVDGTVTLAEAKCTAPGGEKTGTQTVPDEKKPVEQRKAQDEPAGTGADLAATGGSSATPYLAGGAALLVVAGGGALFAVRRRKAAQHG